MHTDPTMVQVRTSRGVGHVDRQGSAGRRNIAELVYDRVVAQPGRTAVRDAPADVELSYRQLWDSAGAVAGRLIELGLRPGGYVAVDLPRGAGLFVSLLGIVRAGAAYLPLDPHAPQERLDAMIAETGTRWVIGSATARRSPDLIHMALTEVAAWTGIDGALSIPVEDDSPAYVAYTSGSTGHPKGVVVPHRAVRRLATGQDYCRLHPGDRVACSSNPAFDATTFEVWSTLIAGATAVVLPTLTDLDLDQWIALLRDQRVDTMFLTTSLFHMVARERPDAFRSVRDLLVGGEQLHLDLARAVLAAAPPQRLVNAYGPTETTTFASYFLCTPKSLAGRERVPIGFALNQTSLHVLDHEHRPVDTGQVGELHIGGPGVATGYLGRPDLTSQRFVAGHDGAELVYRTGDLARADENGCVELLGRADRQVKLRGFRIELEEIEAAALRTGLVGAAYVERVGDGPAALLVGFALPSATGGELSVRALTEALSRELPEYMMPGRWLAVTRIPLGPTGKTDRAALLALLDNGSAAPARPQSTTVIGGIREICADVLGVAQVAAQDNFIDLGGNSILAIQLASRLRQRLRLDLGPADVLLAESLADLALLHHSGGK